MPLFLRLFRRRNRRLGEGTRIAVSFLEQDNSRRVKVIDCFRFFNELELLKLRLETLWPVVDYFVITESVLTHSGKKKEMLFEKHFQDFAKYSSKIIYNPIYVEDEDEIFELDKSPFRIDWDQEDPNARKAFRNIPPAYRREAFERDDMIRGAAQISAFWNPNSIILSSDLDEIPNPRILKNLDWISKDNLYICEQTAYMYKLNLLYQDVWFGTRIFRSSYMFNLRRGFHEIHAQRNDITYVKDAGWHFTWLGDANDYIIKLAAQPEVSFDTELFRNNAFNTVSKGLDPIGRELKLRKVEIDSTFPEPIVLNPEAFNRFLAI